MAPADAADSEVSGGLTAQQPSALFFENLKDLNGTYSSVRTRTASPIKRKRKKGAQAATSGG
jgi:hypothetical protein